MTTARSASPLAAFAVFAVACRPLSEPAPEASTSTSAAAASARAVACRPATWSHECAVNRPVCGCDGRTLRGTPCAGIIRERWSSTDRCACKGKTQAQTCAQTMREPWSKA